MASVKFYTVKESAPCQQAKRLLDQLEVFYEEIDVSSEQAATELESYTGQWTVPAVVVLATDGNTIRHRVVGFEPRALRDIAANLKHQT